MTDRRSATTTTTTEATVGSRSGAACRVPAELVKAEPQRFFKPTTSASGTFSDWLGVFLDTTGANAVDWDEIAAIVDDAFRHVAPRSLVTGLDRT
jgi:hypothetical protein